MDGVTVVGELAMEVGERREAKPASDESQRPPSQPSRLADSAELSRALTVARPAINAVNFASNNPSATILLPALPLAALLAESSRASLFPQRLVHKANIERL